MKNVTRSLAGRTIRWTFNDGPTAGTTYEHDFFPDGTVTWRSVNNGNPTEKAEKKPKKTSTKPPSVPYASFDVAPNVHLVSYLSDSGYTLTVNLNLETLRCYGVASNGEEWYPSAGTVEVIK